jgi:hypothetical protein
MLPHEKLEVYGKAIDFIGDASAAVALWDKRRTTPEVPARSATRAIVPHHNLPRKRPHGSGAYQSPRSQSAMSSISPGWSTWSSA